MNLNCVKNISKDYVKTFYFAFENEEVLPSFLTEENKNILKNNQQLLDFKAEAKKSLELGFIQDNKSIILKVVGLGKKEEFKLNKFREVLYSTLKDVDGEVLLAFSSKESENLGLIAEVLEHINYKFDKYFSKKSETKLSVDVYTEQTAPSLSEEYELAKISTIVKDLINEQAEVMNPKALAETAQNLGKEFGFDVKILDEKEAEAVGMHAYLAVARAAHHRPYVIVMSYMGDKNSEYKYGLVGKGLTYDTGGLSLKPSDSMMNMKDDMGGSATMIGAMCAIAQMKLNKNVICVVAACENSIGPNAYRPSDVVTTMNGKTIEINNTDAEGRVTLADALTYIIREQKVDEVIDAATLTGAMLVALGEDLTGVFTNDDDFAKEFIKASENWMEYFWQMPMNDSFKRYLKSEVADLQNSGGRMGGSITAAKFLEEFVEGKKWLHLDIAGTAFCNGNNSYYKKGATGQVFRTIYTYIKNN